MKGHIIFTESSHNVGGQEMQLMQQMQALQVAGYRCILACRPNGRVDLHARQLGLERCAVAFRNSCHLPSILKLRQLMQSTQAQMVICHSGHDANNVALAARLLRNRPFLLRSRTYLTGKQKAVSYNRLVDAVMVPSQFIKDCLLQDPKVDLDKIHVVYPGIDFERLDALSQSPINDAIADWLAAGTGPVILQVAMLRAEKGHLTLLDALAQYHRQRPDCRYLIAGEGSERPIIEARIAALQLQQQVFLAGNVIPVHGLYRHADCLVMPSTSEPLGMSQIEALSLGVPVIASHTGGIPETVHDGVTGMLVPAGDSQAWAQALEQALAQPDKMRAMAQRGREDVRARFSVAHNLQQILQLLAAWQQRR